MKFKVLLNDMCLYKNDRKYLILLFCFSIILTVMMIKFHQSRGAFNTDIFTYLVSTLSLAGINMDIANPHYIQNSPVIIFLTSLLFRLGFVDITSIFIVTGLFGILGIFGIYTFLKIRFSALLSLTGAILYSSLSLTLYYFANGMLDMPAVSMIIWTLIFTVMAVDKNPKYYILVAISFTIAFFIRYTSGCLIILIVLYMFKNYDVTNLFECLFNKKIFKERIINFIQSKEFKWMRISTIMGVLLFLIIFAVLFSYYPILIYFRMAGLSVSGHYPSYDPNFIEDKLFYIKNFLNLISCNSITFNIDFTEKFNNITLFSYLIIVILFSGIQLKFLNYVKNISFLRNYKHLKFRNKKFSSKLMISTLILIIIAFIGVKFSYIISLICLLGILIILMSLIKEYPINRDEFTLSLLCFSLFSFYLVIFSFMDIKCVRYILPIFPAFVYFVICALDYIIEFINYGFDNEETLLNKFHKKNIIHNKPKNKIIERISYYIPVVLIIISLCFAFNFPNTVDIYEDGLDIIKMSDFVKKYDSDYKSKEFMVSSWDVKNFEWYLNTNINRLWEQFGDDNPNSYDYVITFGEPLKVNNYRMVYNQGHYYLNEKIT